MKGIITKYDEDKGFGFIKDENEQKRFFHISEINEKHIFLNDISKYYYTEFYERECCIVSFDASENDKGLCAVNIRLTEQIFNDKSDDIEFEAEVVDFKYFVDSLTRTVSGIKKGKSAPFGATTGSNGTYRIGYPESLRLLHIHFRKKDDIGWGVIEVRELVLSINNKSKITEKLVSSIKNNLLGKKITIIQKDKIWNLKDSSILKV